ncbi:MAG: bifunctional UDP-sugar hydrolase/5'-nucleotidase [Thermodesulfobacteriota bacterium]
MKKKTAAFTIHFLLFFIFISFVWAGEPVQLRILYLNDFHGFAEPYQPVGSPEKLGGIAFLAEEVNRLRKERPTLLLAAGDMIQGNPWANLSEGRSTIEVMNAMDFSAMVLGNHEFDFGQEVLKKRIQEARFPVLAANVQGLTDIKPYVLKEISGLKIAIVGLITEETPTSTDPKNVKGLAFNSMIDSAQKVIQELGDQPDLVIVLSHLGLQANRRLAQTVKGIQIIVGGHSHTRIESPMKIDGTLLVQAWEHAKVLGVLDLTIQDRKVIQYEGKLVVIRPDKFRPDPVVAEIVDRYQRQTASILDEVIGETLVDLEGKGSRSQETNLGNLIADILKKETQADVALTNGGGIRADILKGPIRRKDVLSVLPFSNYPVVLKVKGQELKAIFEYGVSDPDGTGGRFPQVSGIQLTYTPMNPVGQRITNIRVGGKPLDLMAWYTLATLDFLAAGGDGYFVLKDIIEKGGKDSAQNYQVLLFDSSRKVSDLVTNYIKEKKQISASVEGRIQKEN